MFDCFRVFSSEFQAIPVDVWAEPVFTRPLSGQHVAFALTVSHYRVDIKSPTGTAQLGDEMFLLQAKPQSCYAVASPALQVQKKGLTGLLSSVFICCVSGHCLLSLAGAWLLVATLAYFTVCYNHKLLRMPGH